jgi:hypothetical protein
MSVRYKTRHFAGVLIILLTLWLSINALRQTRQVRPGETLEQAIRSLVFGRPVLGSRLCSDEVHRQYAVTGPDGETYLTWHPPLNLKNSCYFDHEHGSDPASYVGFESSGLPPFGYISVQAGVEEPHRGYKVYVTNDDLNGRAWMIVLNQDTSQPSRAWVQHYSLDWHIASVGGEPLVHVRVMADFGRSSPNCRSGVIWPASSSSDRFRSIPTTDCAGHNAFESWSGVVDVAGVFWAGPVFDVDNPITAIDPDALASFRPICEFRPAAEGCAATAPYWSGNRRGIRHPGQLVRNQAGEYFYTDPYGNQNEQGDEEGILQFVTNDGWDSRQCCGPEVVFRIQTFSGGVYIAAPPEPAGSAEFSFGLP